MLPSTRCIHWPPATCCWHYGRVFSAMLPTFYSLSTRPPSGWLVFKSIDGLVGWWLLLYLWGLWLPYSLASLLLFFGPSVDFKFYHKITTNSKIVKKGETISGRPFDFSVLDHKGFKTWNKLWARSIGCWKNILTSKIKPKETEAK